MRTIDKIIIHCTDTPTGRHTTVADIDQWHVERGWQRQAEWRKAFNPELKAIGYHFVIYTDGDVRTGRNVNEIGAHCAGLNSSSIGVAIVGRGVYSQIQWDVLRELVINLRLTYPNAKVIGHYETPTGMAQGKHCPEFNVQLWMAQGMAPDTANVG